MWLTLCALCVLCGLFKLSPGDWTRPGRYTPRPPRETAVERVCTSVEAHHASARAPSRALRVTRPDRWAQQGEGEAQALERRTPPASPAADARSRRSAARRAWKGARS